MRSVATIVLIAASAAIAQAQVTYNASTNTFTCPASNPNGDFCAGDSLVTNIIIRCTNGVGQPGNCNDNLAGKPPLGVNYSPCYQSSPTSGDAACSKNCIVYGSSGNYNGTFTLPNCTVTSSSATSATSAPTSSTSATETPVSTAIVPPGSSAAASSGTLATSATSFATATPVGPTSAPIVVTTSGAGVNSASVMAAIGLIVAYFL